MPFGLFGSKKPLQEVQEDGEKEPVVPQEAHEQAPSAAEGSSGTQQASTDDGADYGDLVYTKPGTYRRMKTSWNLMRAAPWRRVSKGAVLTIELRQSVKEMLPGFWVYNVSLPAIRNCLLKATYDPRISGLLLKVGPVDCGWAKIQEILRHIRLFRQSGKSTVAFLERGGEKEYLLACGCDEVYTNPVASLNLRGMSMSGTFLRGTLDKVGVEPQVRRIGKYKSFGDTIVRESMSDPQREQMSELLEDMYQYFVDVVAESRKKTAAEVMHMLDEGFVEMSEYKAGGWVTDLKYFDEVEKLIKDRQGRAKKDSMAQVTLRQYTSVSLSAFGLTGPDTIAVIRAVGGITGSGQGASPNTITCKKLAEDIRKARDRKNVKAIVLRVDSPGGDVLASDVLWREVRMAARKKPVVASMGDVAASGGYYLSMAADKIVAERLTITGSIGVVVAKFSFAEMYKKIGVGREMLSKGQFAGLFADGRSFSKEEDEYFTRVANIFYNIFRDKAAECRNLSVEDMENYAQGRVWSGARASRVGLVDALGGIDLAVDVAKRAAKIPPKAHVHVWEVCRERGFMGVSGAGASALGSLLLAFLGRSGESGSAMDVLQHARSQQGLTPLLMGVEGVDGSASAELSPQAMLDAAFLGRVDDPSRVLGALLRGAF
ncbi:unnamed protein product [Ostreobium quekettii]|uniref:Peptidase S49 domain-containing protein n=1 Tax=Ostreobium quekettii TaxID=121088 RepID=A0A8S1JE06_9CHLO|nr:unnamed protein product [Ostreobium quekettii]